MPKKLTKTIYLLIISDFVLQGMLMIVNNKSALTIRRWAQKEKNELLLKHNLEVILNYCQDIGLNDYENTEDLFAEKETEFN